MIGVGLIKRVKSSDFPYWGIINYFDEKTGEKIDEFDVTFSCETIDIIASRFVSHQMATGIKLHKVYCHSNLADK